MKVTIFALIIALASCGSTPAQTDRSQQDAGEEHLSSSTRTNTFNGISVEVIGIPYEYKDICGYRSLDSLIEAEYKLISTGQSSSFVNFSIDRFILNFNANGSLVISTVYSYDKTPAQNGGILFCPIREDTRMET